jgi:hypothetical protein
MKLLKYEMKKLLFNKNRLILLAVMFVIYGLIGFTMASDEFELNHSEDAKAAYNKYRELISENTGKLNSKQLAESNQIFHAAIDKYGRGEGLIVRINRDPVLKFHSMYSSFGQRVNEYWNGPDEQDMEDVKGVYPIQNKLEELEKANLTHSYEHKYYKNHLNALLSIGEPVFVYAFFWNIYFTMFEGIIVIFLFMMILTFFISPLFTQEVKTEMDSIVLCSAKGRHEIVIAKLLCAGLTSAIIAVVYIIGFSIGIFAGYNNLNGFDSPVRSLDGFQWTMLDMTIGGAGALAAIWLIVVAVFFGLVLSFVSSKTKNQSAAFGLGIAILLAGSMSNYIGSEFQKVLWPLVDFNFGTLSMFNAIFGGNKVYNVFGMPVPYGAAALAVGLTLGAVACLLTFIAQKKRSVV